MGWLSQRNNLGDEGDAEGINDGDRLIGIEVTLGQDKDT